MSISYYLYLAVDCGSLNNPRNGEVTLTGTTLRSEALYSCNSGFVLVGENRRVCQTNGEWSGEAPTCTGSMVCQGVLIRL